VELGAHGTVKDDDSVGNSRKEVSVHGTSLADPRECAAWRNPSARRSPDGRLRVIQARFNRLAPESMLVVRVRNMLATVSYEEVTGTEEET
jgi:hypothetical protein